MEIYKIKTEDFFKIFNYSDKSDNENLNNIITSLEKSLHTSGDCNIKLDREDIVYCFKNSRVGYITSIKTSDIKSDLKQIAENIILKCQNSSLVDNIVIHFRLTPSYDMMKISNDMDIIHDSAHEDASVCFCITCDSNLEKNEAQISAFIFY